MKSRIGDLRMHSEFHIQYFHPWIRYSRHSHIPPTYCRIIFPAEDLFPMVTL
jgi:hypothetical protein